MTDVNADTNEEEEVEEKVDPIVKAPDLYDAVQKNDFDTAMGLLSEEVPPSHCDVATGQNCLYWATKHGNAKLVKALIEKGGSQHYHHAKKMQILDPSADIQEDLADQFILNSPLLTAAYCGYMSITWILIADGYSPDDCDSLGNTSVHLAACAGHHNVLKILLADGAQISVFNKFRNTPFDIAITTETRQLLLNEKERRDANSGFESILCHTDLLKKHTKLSKDLLTAVTNATTALSVSNELNDTKDLTEAMEAAQLWEVEPELVEEAEQLTVRINASRNLQNACAKVLENCPIRKQIDYIKYVTDLETLVEKLEVEGVDRSILQPSRDLITRCQIEYWLSTSIDRMKDVTKANESNEHDILRLKACIQKAEALGSSEALVDEAAIRLRQLEAELEMSRAVATYQKERLPVENPPPDYWQPCDLGYIEETEEFPLPPEGGEYIWVPSAAYTRVRVCLERLKNCLVGIETCNANEELIVEVKDKIVKSEKDFKLLEVKDMEDKKKFVDSATKAAKKLKKTKKKK